MILATKLCYNKSMKKTIKNLFCIFNVVLFLIPAITAQESKTVDVMFTHDVHSFLDRIAQAKTLINQQKAVNPDTLVLDAGDFSQGTLYQTVYSTKAAELRILGLIGVEATTMGNHEFDCMDTGVAGMLTAARKSGDTVPEFLLCNVDWNKDDEYTKTVKAACDFYGVKDYHVFIKNGVRIAVFGLFGENSLFCAPTCKLTFFNQYDQAAKIVKQIKEKENPDMIVCISHGGTDKNIKKSEDEILAKKVPDIDLIISGHSHTILEKPIQYGNTYIASCGEYAQNIGSLSMKKTSKDRWEITRYEILSTEGISPDAIVSAKLESFKKDIDTEYLSKFGYETNEILGTASTNYTHPEMGHIIADMYRKTVSKYEIKSENSEKMGTGNPIDMAVVPTGVAREDLLKGNVTTKDIFNAFSLGIGPDEIAGYPLVSVYLSGRELKNACEIDYTMGTELGSPLLSLYFSGITYEYNPHRMLLDKVTKVYILKDNGTKEEVQDKKLYRIVSDIYTGKMLGSVNKLTYGLLSLIPKNSDGTVVENLDDNIIRTSIFPGTSEFKAWTAIARGVQITGDIGDYSAIVEAANTAVPSRNPFKIFSHPSKFAEIAYCLIFVLIAVIVLIVILCIRHSNKKKKNR